MSEWSHLSNAHHIDRVLASVKKYPKIWNDAQLTTSIATSDAAYDAARDESWVAARDVNLDVIWYATMVEAHNPKRIGSTQLANGAILALIAYDDCDQYLSMPSEQLRMWVTLTEKPAAVLLLPAVIAFEQIKKLKNV
jgi:hypothetical protein